MKERKKRGKTYSIFESKTKYDCECHRQESADPVKLSELAPQRASVQWGTRPRERRTRFEQAEVILNGRN